MARINGKDRMRRVLKALPKAERKRLRTEILDSAEMVARDQRSFAPVRTGALRDSIKVTPGDENLPAYASLKSRRTFKDPELAAIITAGNRAVRYAHLVEFGTAAHPVGGKFEGAAHPGSAAQPFFFPPFRSNRRRVQARINKAARQGIKDGLK